MFHVLCEVKRMELQVLHLARLIIPETKFENPQILYALIDMNFFLFLVLAKILMWASLAVMWWNLFPTV